MPYDHAEFTRDAVAAVAENDRVPAQRAPEPEPLTLAAVDRMLWQVGQDRLVPYWQGEPRGATLDHAETWLLSLRDWVASVASERMSG